MLNIGVILHEAYIRDYSEKIAPLHALTRKGVVVSIWGLAKQASKLD
jgi:hypothetical protein